MLAERDLEPEQVRLLSEDEGWPAKIRRVSLMSKSGKPGDWERSQHRALCFVQAACLRNQVSRLLHEVTNMTNEELLSRACVRTRDGGAQLSAKFLVDLANAAEAAHRMGYQSLGDTVTERCDSDSVTGERSSNDLHAAIIASLSNPGESPLTVTKLLEDEATAKAAELSSANLRPVASAGAQPEET
jgi:hypothetical protein